MSLDRSFAEIQASLASLQTVFNQQIVTGIPLPFAKLSTSSTDIMALTNMSHTMHMMMNNMIIAQTSMALDMSLGMYKTEQSLKAIHAKLDARPTGTAATGMDLKPGDGASKLDAACKRLDSICSSLGTVCDELNSACDGLKRARANLHDTCDYVAKTCEKLRKGHQDVAAALLNPASEVKVDQIEDASSGAPEDDRIDLAAHGAAASS